MSPELLFALGGYLIGSIPVAYLLVKAASGKDIRKGGSGNVGGFNAFVVSGSKTLGILAGVLDGVKGLVPAALAAALTGEYRVAALGLLSAVTGHMLPVWLRFRGGRGLATACGGLFVLSPSYIIVWCSTWGILKGLGRSILAANTVATVLSPLLLLLVPLPLLQYLGVLPVEGSDEQWFAFILSFLLLLGHRNALGEVLRELKTMNLRRKEGQFHKEDVP